MNKLKKPKKKLTIPDGDKLYGTTTVGARGQVVIPAQARKELDLKSGDQLLVMGKMGKVLGLVKVDQLSEFVNMIMEQVAGTEIEDQARSHVQKIFGDVSAMKKHND